MFGLSRILRLAVAVVVAEILARKANMPNEPDAAGKPAQSASVVNHVLGKNATGNSVAIFPNAGIVLEDIGTGLVRVVMDGAATVLQHGFPELLAAVEAQVLKSL